VLSPLLLFPTFLHQRLYVWFSFLSFYTIMLLYRRLGFFYLFVCCFFYFGFIPYTLEITYPVPELELDKFQSTRATGTSDPSPCPLLISQNSASSSSYRKCRCFHEFFQDVNRSYHSMHRNVRPADRNLPCFFINGPPFSFSLLGLKCFVYKTMWSSPNPTPLIS
jgi:hypothetical protein